MHTLRQRFLNSIKIYIHNILSDNSQSYLCNDPAVTPNTVSTALRKRDKKENIIGAAKTVCSITSSYSLMKPNRIQTSRNLI